MNYGRNFACSTLLACMLPVAPPAAAMTLSYSTTWDGSSNVISGAGTITTMFDPVHDGFSHAFTAPTPCCVMDGSQATQFGFLDDYVFDAPAGSFIASIASPAADTGDIQGLWARLYSLSAGGTTNRVPTIGNPDGAVLSAVAQGTDEGPLLMLYGKSLAPGRYSLQISGNVRGPSGGRYTGWIGASAAPTPLPGALPLLLSGVGLLMVLRREPRRQ